MFDCYLLETCSSLMGDTDGMELNEKGDGEELVGVEGGETALKLYYMRKIYS